MSLFGNKSRVATQSPVKARTQVVQVEAPVDKKTHENKDPESFYEFQKCVFDVKESVISAVERTDKQGAIENLLVLSNLSAKAIYSQNLREIVIVEDAIGEIKKKIDHKLASLKVGNGKPSPEAEYYTLIRLSMIPVCSMLNVLDSHTTAAISQANEEIDDKIQELQRFLVDYETQLVKDGKKK